MKRETLFVVTLIIISSLAAYVAFGMFAVGTMEEFEKSKMYFAAAVLAFLAFIFMLAIIFYGLGPEPKDSNSDNPGKSIFDACVKVIPPIVTLIIGFYFGASQDSINNEPQTTVLTESSSPDNEAP